MVRGVCGWEGTSEAVGLRPTTHHPPSRVLRSVGPQIRHSLWSAPLTICTSLAKICCSLFRSRSSQQRSALEWTEGGSAELAEELAVLQKRARKRGDQEGRRKRASKVSASLGVAAVVAASSPKATLRVRQTAFRRPPKWPWTARSLPHRPFRSGDTGGEAFPTTPLPLPRLASRSFPTSKARQGGLLPSEEETKRAWRGDGGATKSSPSTLGELHYRPLTITSRGGPGRRRSNAVASKPSLGQAPRMALDSHTSLSGAACPEAKTTSTTSPRLCQAITERERASHIT